MALFVAVAMPAPQAAADASIASRTCKAMLLPTAKLADRPVDIETLARLRDIGFALRDIPVNAKPLAVSADGSRVAFQISRADPATNTMCLGMVVMPLREGGQPILVDIGGERVTTGTSSLGLANFPTGVSQTIEPHWAADGRSIAYLKRTGGRTRLWRADIAGKWARPIVSLPVDIDRVVWAPGDTRILIASRPGVAAADRAIDTEGRSGYVYDDRAFPLGTVRPLVADVYPTVIEAIDVDTGRRRPATEAEKAMFGGKDESVAPVARLVRRRGDDAAWVQPDRPDALIPRLRVWERYHGQVRRCDAEDCLGDIRDLWFAADGRSVLFMRTDGFGGGLQSFFHWDLSTGQVRRTKLEDAMYSSCSPTGVWLACVRETPLRPGEVVLLDPITGRTRLVFNANPEITGHFRGTVEHLSWTDAYGISSFGELTLPPGYRAGQRLPLIVVQYRSTGFQRGGIGDEVPILPLAEAGFAVLNFNRPDGSAAARDVRTTDEGMHQAMSNWQEERDVLASLEDGVRRLVARGVVDKGRIGITGLSAGAQTAQFALNHSSMFAAASMSTCCKDPVTLMATAGRGLRSAQERWGLAPIESGNAEQWRGVSLAMNVDHIHTPILLQLSSWEFRAALETVSAFQAKKRPLELIVFPEEHHVKDQPAHRLAVYKRNLEWFDFWLNGKVHPGLGNEPQYARWRRLQRQALDTP